MGSTIGSENFFYKWPGSEYFWHCRLHLVALCLSPSLPLCGACMRARAGTFNYLKM